MDLYIIISIVLTLAAIVGYVNIRFIHMPPTIAIMAVTLILSFILAVMNLLGISTVPAEIITGLSKVDFPHIVLNIMLSFLLFAGGLSVNFRDIYRQRWEITSLSVFSTVASALLIGFLLFYMLNALSIHLSLLYCLLFGALISPTDPIAVLALCKTLNAPRKLSILLAGESLFNDGIGIVLFITLYEMLFLGGQFTWTRTITLFLQEAIGGIIYGLILGWLADKLIKSINDHKIAILITIALTTGGYNLAIALNISGPLAMVIAGIILGARYNPNNKSEFDTGKLEHFWQVIDEALNALLFSLLGLELLHIHLGKIEILASLVAIPLVLLVRFITVAIPLSIFKIWHSYNTHIVKILTWGGLRGGLAVALALSLPEGYSHDLILTMTYMVVVFAIIVQGISVKKLLNLSKEVA